MHAAITTVAFRGIETIPVEVQVHIANGLPAMAIVGLADKAVAESCERVRAALGSIGLALPPKRIAVNLAPANVVKEGAHFDLPIALSLLVAMGAIPSDAVANMLVLPELSLHGGIEPVTGVLPAAMAAVAAGRHNLLMIGPPGAGKSMLAARLPGLLPPLSPREALDVTMLHSIAGQLPAGGLIQTRSYRDPNHSASMAALLGGGARAKPGEISLAHRGVLFLDELAEFAKPVLDALRQPLETGSIVVARANHHVTYPAEFQLVAAMNPCRCGYLGDPARACARAPACGRSYCERISGPMLDRFDLIIELPEVDSRLLLESAPAETSGDIAARVRDAARFASSLQATRPDPDAHLDSHLAPGRLTDPARQLLELAVDKQALTARGFHRVLRVARTISNLARSEQIDRPHLAEALAYRAMPLLA